jgi:hypothetical protein
MRQLFIVIILLLIDVTLGVTGDATLIYSRRSTFSNSIASSLLYVDSDIQIIHTENSFPVHLNCSDVLVYIGNVSKQYKNLYTSKCKDVTPVAVNIPVPSGIAYGYELSLPTILALYEQSFGTMATHVILIHGNSHLPYIHENLKDSTKIHLNMQAFNVNACKKLKHVCLSEFLETNLTDDTIILIPNDVNLIKNLTTESDIDISLMWNAVLMNLHNPIITSNESLYNSGIPVMYVGPDLDDFPAFFTSEYFKYKTEHKWVEFPYPNTKTKINRGRSISIGRVPVK